MAKHSKPRLTIKDSEKETVAELGEEDVGIIIRANMEIELFLPNRDESEVMGDAEMQGFAIMMALGDPELSQRIMDAAEAKMEAAEDSDDEEEVEVEADVAKSKKKHLN